MNENLIPNARLYAARHQLELAETLGSGKDGIVLVAKRKAQPARVAIKVFRLSEAYEREKAVYLRLQELEIDSVLGFNVPRLVRFDDAMLVVEITVVKRPFVLDFAGAYLEARPDFPEEVWSAGQKLKR
jgi:hypothetical protein